MKVNNLNFPFVLAMQVADDPVFARDGADVYVDSNISFTQVNTESLCEKFVVCLVFLLTRYTLSAAFKFLHLA